MTKVAAALLAAFLLLGLAVGQVNVAPLQNPRVQYLDGNGKPLAGGKLYTYQAGSSTPQATYTDSTGTSANANPVILDASGAGTIWLGPYAYKVVAQNSAGVQQWSVDGVTGNSLLISVAIASPAITGGTIADAAISGGSIDNTPIGQTTPAAAKFSTVSAADINGAKLASETVTSVPVAAPALSAGLSLTATGGTVAANSYTAQITFVGANGGETTASSASAGITTSGATSALYCNSAEAPAGASGFNCYVQTGGSGAYYKQGSTTAIAGVLAITTTPVMSGSTPPVSNTAVASVAAAKASLSGGAGKVTVPNAVSTGAGVAGDPGTNQVIEDQRYGTIYRRSTGVPMKTSTYGAVLGVENIDMPLAGQLTTGQQAQAFSAVVHAEDSPYYGIGANPANPSAAVGGYFGAYRGGTRTETLWGADIVAAFTNQLNPVYGLEIDVFNQSGVDASGTGGGVGAHILSLGNNKALRAIWIDDGAQAWKQGLYIGQNTVSDLGIYIPSGIVVGLSTSSPAQFVGSSTADTINIVPFNDLGSNWAIHQRNHANNADTFGVYNNGLVVSTAGFFGPAYMSSSGNQASSGVVRLSSADTVCWRNNANNADLCITKDSSDNFIIPGGYTGTKVAGACTFNIVGGIIRSVAGC